MAADPAAGGGKEPWLQTERPSAGNTTDLLDGKRCSNFGSRFWALADELSSEDDEHKDTRQQTPRRNGWATNQATSDMGAIDAIAKVGAPVQGAGSGHGLATEQVTADLDAIDATTKVCAPVHGAGSTDAPTGGTHHRTQTRLPLKPWRGLLPKPRASPNMTFGDVLARARRSKAPRPGTQSATKEHRRSNFESRRHGTRDSGGCRQIGGSTREQTDRAMSIVIHNNGKTAQFTYSAGLGRLFS